MIRFPMKNLTLVAVACACVGGCGLPPSLQVASWAVDGISYLATDKTVADHGLSALSGQDCKVMRVASAQPVCLAQTPGVDFNGNLDPHAATLLVDLPACKTGRMAEQLTGGMGINHCARALVERFGAEGALNFADGRILALIDAGRMDDAGIWYGVQATVRSAADAG